MATELPQTNVTILNMEVDDLKAANEALKLQLIEKDSAILGYRSTIEQLQGRVDELLDDLQNATNKLAAAELQAQAKEINA